MLRRTAGQIEIEPASRRRLRCRVLSTAASLSNRIALFRGADAARIRIVFFALSADTLDDGRPQIYRTSA